MRVIRRTIMRVIRRTIMRVIRRTGKTPSWLGLILR